LAVVVQVAHKALAAVVEAVVFFIIQMHFLNLEH
jgi:hypothetical protein